MSEPGSSREVAGTSPTSQGEVLISTEPLLRRSVESTSDVALTATKSIGGQYGHVTKLLQQLYVILDSSDYPQACDVLELQNRIKVAHTKYSKAVREFCIVLGEGSERGKEYMGQLKTRDDEVQVADERINAFLVEGLTVGSVVTSMNSRSRHSKKRSRSDNNSMQSCTTLSSAHKARLDMRMAEVNLEKAKHEQALIAKAQAEGAKADALRVKAESDQRAQEALLESERAIIQAEADLAKAKIISEASQGLLDLEDGEPPLSAHDKVNYYVNNLPLPEDNPGLSNLVQGPNATLSNVLPQVDVDLVALAPSCQTIATHHPVTADSPPLALHTASWSNPLTFLSSSKSLKPLEQSVPVISSNISCPGSPPGVLNNSPYGLVTQGPAVFVSNTSSSQLFKPLAPMPSVALTNTYLTHSCDVAVNTTTASAQTAFDGPAVPISNNLGFQAPRSFMSVATVPNLSYQNNATLTPGLATSGTPALAYELASHGPAASANNLLPPSVSLNSEPNLIYSHQPSMVSVPYHPPKSDASKSSVEEFARVLVRCQGSRALAEEERYSGDPLRYHQFIRQMEDRILNIHAQTDPGHALQLLLESTTGRARKLISSCIMLPPAEALTKALQLLFKSFGSPAVAVKAHLRLVCEGPPIHIDERSLQDFYSDLINCKMVVESANATHLLNSAATAEGIFSRFPQHFQRQFAELALRRGYDMEVVPFDLFVEFVDQ